MEARKLRMSKRALGKLAAQLDWYYGQCMYSFAESMEGNLFADIDVLCLTPTIGRLLKKVNRKEYRVFVSHKLCIIVYRYSAKTLYVEDLIFTDTHSPRIF